MSRKMLAVLLVMLLLPVGCAVTGEKLLPQIERRLAKLDGYTAECNVEIFTDESVQVYSVKQWHAFPSRWRVEVEAGEESQIFICDGRQIWVYQPSLGDYYRLEITETTRENAAPFLLYGYLQQLLEAESFTFRGEAELNGGAVYRVDYPGPLAGETVSLWLNRKSYLPEQMELSLEEKLLCRVKVKKSELNPDFSPDLFTFTPDGAGKVGAYCEIAPLTLEEAKKGWPGPVYLPAYLPGGTKLHAISRVLEAGREQLICVFRGDVPFTFIQAPANETGLFAGSRSREVVIGRNTGIYQQNAQDNLASLFWSADGRDFVLSGVLSLQELVKIAVSLFPDGQ
ncbi:MAG TPA: hypothetical protein GX699_02365 [Firmicutes bacterium]|nr:hypothetical protein [Bacillota bacterium]